MFQHLPPTQHPPQEPTLLWDGHCGFCAYWVTRWQNMGAQGLSFIPYQEGATAFPDIDLQHFKEASRLIEPDGRIFSGPASAYRSLSYGSIWARRLDRWYAQHKSFSRFSDKLYQWVADHRNGLFRLTKVLWGSDPQEPRPFWAIYLGVVLYAIYQFA